MDQKQIESGVVVPAGWKLVPDTATPEMIKAGLEKVALAERIGMPEYSSDDGIDMAWDAMLAATPTAPAAQPQPVAKHGELPPHQQDDEHKAFMAVYLAAARKSGNNTSAEMILWHGNRHWNGKPGEMWRARAALAKKGGAA